MMNYNSLLGRIDKIRRFTGYYHITANSLRETRIIHEIIDITKEKELYQPNDEVYDEVLKRIYRQYNVKISHMQLYSIKQKFNQLINIKDF